MKKAIPLIDRMDALLPSAKISVPAQHEPDVVAKSEWIEGLKELVVEYDSVTIHDCSCKQNLVQNLSTTQPRQCASTGC